MPPLTVILPCYNPPAAVFADTLASLSRSTFRDFETIVVDDGSTDIRWQAVLLEYFPAARVLRHEANRGLAAARNTGVAACRTPYFLQLDADDQVTPTFIEKALWALESHAEWSFVNAWHTAFGGENFRWDKGFEQGRAHLYLNQSIPVAVIRTQADRAIGGHDESIREGNEDWDYWLKMAAHGLWGGTIPEYLLRYRTHTPPTFWPNRDDSRQLAKFRAQMRRRYPELWRRSGWPRPPRPTGPDSLRHNLPFLAALPANGGVSPEKRLLLMVPWLTLGGADRFNLMLLEMLHARGFVVTMCATADGPSPWLEKFLQFTDDVFILRHFLRLEDYPRFLRHLIAARGVGTVLMTAAQMGYSLLPYLCAHCPDVTFVDYVHMVDLRWRAGGYARASVNAQAELDLSLVSSQQAKDWMTAEGADSKRVKVTYINIDSATWKPGRFDRQAIRQKLGLNGGEYVILYAARLAQQKRPRLLVEILDTLRKRGRRFTALIAGDGPQFNWLRDRVDRSPLRHCTRLLGAVEPEQMPELMAASDVFLLPSEDEGIALTLYEAMAMELAVVAANVGGQSELVTPETGILIPPGAGETDAYVAAVERLAADPAGRSAMGRAARRRVVEHFSAPQLADRLEALIGQAHALHQTAPRPRLSDIQAQAVAQEVVDAERQLGLAEQLFSEHGHEFSIGAQRKPRVGLRLVRAAKQYILYPLYNWGLEQGWEWLVPLKNQVYRLLGGRLIQR